MKNRVIEMEKDGFKGSAEIQWVENDGYNAPHYRIVICVPFKNPSVVRTFRKDYESVLEYAKEELEGCLDRCTLF